VSEGARAGAPDGADAAAVRRATGRFEVTVTPQPAQDGIGDPVIGRMALHKVFEGPVAGESRGQMLATRTDTPGSAGYVALERFEGALDGRHGGFSLQHSGTMERGAAALAVHVVPDSGSGDLAGLRGTMAIRVEDGRHFYDFDYQL
jgi:hypothetical protein